MTWQKYVTVPVKKLHFLSIRVIPARPRALNIGRQPATLTVVPRQLRLNGYNRVRADGIRAFDSGKAFGLAAPLRLGCREPHRPWSAPRISTRLTLVNIILVFGRNNDRNVQCIVNGRTGDRMWTYLCVSSNLLNRIGSKNIMKELFPALYIVIVNVKLRSQDDFRTEARPHLDQKMTEHG